MVQINLELIGGLLFFHTHLTLSVTNPLVKRTHDCKLVVDQLAFWLAGQLSSIFPKELGSSNVVPMCIKDDETDYVGLVVLKWKWINSKKKKKEQWYSRKLIKCVEGDESQSRSREEWQTEKKQSISKAEPEKNDRKSWCRVDLLNKQKKKRIVE